MASNPLTSAATNTDMKWAFPTLENPTIIDLSKTGGQDWWQFGANEDVIFIGANTTRTLDKLQTDGGRNIVVLGGDFQPTVNSKGATLHFLNLHGSVHVEGVHIDSKNASQDGIAVAGAPGYQPDVTVQNTKIENIHGAQNDIHADGFQTHGSVGNMHFYNVSVSTDYQGFFISPQYDPPHKSADFENVNVSYTGGSGNTYEYWFLDGNNQKPYPITLKNVYATERAGQHAEDSSVWPKAGLGDGLGAVRVGNQITWPGIANYKGAITVGSPAKDFGDLSKIGLNFKVDAAGVHSGTIGTGATTAPATDTTHTSTGTGTGSTTTTPPVDAHDATHPASGAPTNWIASTDAGHQVTGTAGNDQIAGVEGKADTGGMAGGKGDDTYIVDHPADKVIENAGEGVDNVVSYAPSYQLSANVENLTLAGTKASVGMGNDAANTLTAHDAGATLKGMGGDDLLVGGKAADHLDGGTGADIMKGGLGHDVYYVDNAGDKVIEASNEGVDTVHSTISYTLPQFVENLVLDGTQNINATGNSWHNVLTGNNGNNVLNGGAGDDRLFGAKGNDVMIGGDGKDVFVLKMAGAGTDTIKDFKLGVDNLDMHNVLKSVGAANTSDALKAHLLEVVQNGANTEVIAHAPGHEPAKVAVIENVDATALLKTADHWQ